MLGEPKGTIHLSMLHVLQDGPSAQLVNSLPVFHISCLCCKISIKNKNLKCSLDTCNTLPRWSKSQRIV